MRNLLLSAAIGLPLMLAGNAQAITITGSSGGSFSNLSHCDSSGGFFNPTDCGLANTSNGSNTQVQWADSSYGGLDHPSTLTAIDVNINAVTDATGVIIAKLTWFNMSTPQPVADPTVNWNLTVAFTSPNNSSDSETFNLAITNPTNPSPDLVNGFTVSDLAGLSFNLNGVTVSNLRYVADGGTSFSGTTWSNPEGNTGNLYIEADFKATAVPEPVSMSLLGAGLLGLGLARRKRSA